MRSIEFLKFAERLLQNRTNLYAVAAANFFDDIGQVAVNIGVAALADLTQTFLESEGRLFLVLTPNLIVYSVALNYLHIGSPFRVSPLVVLNIPYVSYEVNNSL
mgnify:CR=1 FL=1